MRFSGHLLSNALELPGANPLKHARAALDAVLAAYGFNAREDWLAQLLAVNQKVAVKIVQLTGKTQFNHRWTQMDTDTPRLRPSSGTSGW